MCICLAKPLDVKYVAKYLRHLNHSENMRDLSQKVRNIKTIKALMLIDNQKDRKMKSILVLTYLGIFKGTTDLFDVFLQVICKT